MPGANPASWEERIYGRFRYIRDHHVFVLVTSTQDVWFYKNGP